MTQRPPVPDLGRLWHADKDALIMALWTRLDDALARLAELEAKLGEPPKTPNNSSVPPSHGHEANEPPRRKRRKDGRPGVGRQPHPDPDRIVEAKAASSPHGIVRLTGRELADQERS